MNASAEPGRPVLRIVKGEAGPEHVAALLAVLAAAGRAAGSGGGGPAAAAGPGGRPGWSDPVAAFRTPVRVGPGSWRASGWTAGARTRAAW